MSRDSQAYLSHQAHLPSTNKERLVAPFHQRYCTHLGELHSSAAPKVHGILQRIITRFFDMGPSCFNGHWWRPSAVPVAQAHRVACDARGTARAFARCKIIFSQKLTFPGVNAFLPVQRISRDSPSCPADLVACAVRVACAQPCTFVFIRL